MRPNYRHPQKPIDRPDHVSLLIPTRGRPENLKTVFANLHETTEHKDLIDVWLYVDDDDAVTRDYIDSGDWKRYGFPINWHVAKSTGAMGDMFNQLWQSCTTNPGLYFPFTDDYTIRTQGWDTVLHDAFCRCSDGIMLGYLPDHLHAPFQVTIPIPSSKWLNVLGYFITNRFYYWFDDQWLDEVAQMTDRKVMIPILLNTPGGRGKTPRMRNLPFWARYFAHTLEDRYDDAARILHAIHADHPVELERALLGARRAAAVLANKANALEDDIYARMEVAYRDTANLPNDAKVLAYLATELYALDELTEKFRQANARNDHTATVDIADTLSLASLKTPDSDYLKARALLAMGYTTDATQAIHHCLAAGSTEPGARALATELAAMPATTQSFYAARSELRMPSWIGLPDLGFILFPETIPHDLGFSIQRLIYDHTINSVIDIGAGSGKGSTQAVLSVLDSNRSRNVFCIEPDQQKCLDLAERHGQRVQIYNGSAAERSGYLSEEAVRDHYERTPTIVNYYPLDTVLQWRRDELARHDMAAIKWGCVAEIKRTHGIATFDMAILDGSLFAGAADLAAVFGATFIVLTHARSIKNHGNVVKLLSDARYQPLEINTSSGCGYAVFRLRATPPGDGAPAKPGYSLREAIELAFKLLSEGEQQRAAAICTELLASGVESFYVHYLLGVIAIQDADWAQATTRLQDALKDTNGIPEDRVEDARRRLAAIVSGAS